jgi:hypothetical protein
MPKTRKSEPTSLPSFERDVAMQFVYSEGSDIAVVRCLDTKLTNEKDVPTLRNFFFVVDSVEAYCRFRDAFRSAEAADIWGQSNSRRLIRLQTFNALWSNLSPLWVECMTEPGYFKENWVDVTVFPPQWYHRLSGLDEKMEFGELKELQRQWNSAVRLVSKFN